MWPRGEPLLVIPQTAFDRESDGFRLAGLTGNQNDPDRSSDRQPVPRERCHELNSLLQNGTLICETSFWHRPASLRISFPQRAYFRVKYRRFFRIAIVHIMGLSKP